MEGGLVLEEESGGSDGGADQPYRMKGIHFAALSAPGLTGARPEHYKEALANPRRIIRNALFKSLDYVINTATRGDLPEAARWILESRLVYLKKKASLTPRPVRIREVLRRMVGKRLKLDSQSEATKVFLKTSAIWRWHSGRRGCFNGISNGC